MWNPEAIKADLDRISKVVMHAQKMNLAPGELSRILPEGYSMRTYPLNPEPDE